MALKGQLIIAVEYTYPDGPPFVERITFTLISSHSVGFVLIDVFDIYLIEI